MAAKKAGAAGSRLQAVDVYIENAAEFARPILEHLREVVHEGAPGVEEAIKWSRPFFVYEGVILGNVSAFKEHCSFGLWGAEMAQTLRADGVGSGEAMGTFGRITSVKELPPRKQLVGYVREAVRKIAEGERTKSITRARVVKPEAVVPEVLAAALAKNAAAGKQFAAMSPSCRREYCDWVAGAKREDTQLRRVAQAVQMIAEGKDRNWLYR